MVKRLSRKELYELVWSEPMKILSARFGISDVALKKTCARAEIPTPDRGYWAKKEAGKSAPQVALPERPLGMDDEVVVAGGSSHWYQAWSEEDLLAPLPPRPEFHEPIEVARERIAKIVGKLSVARDTRYWHPAIDRLLKEDEKRREKQLATPHPMSWDNPRFDTSFERRRLRILNTLFSAAARMNGKPTIDGREARSIHITFYRQHVGIRLDRAKQHNRGGYAAAKPAESNDSKLSLSILAGISSEKERVTWQDDETGKLESRITDIAVELVLTAELQHRESAVHGYQWRVERKAELEEKGRKRKLEAERAERERQRRLEQARIDRLLKDAAAFQQASEIRWYVEAIRVAHSFDEGSSTEALERWSQWALAQADRIDPVRGGAFLKSMRDEEGT
jgi:hypothetical protein